MMRFIITLGIIMITSLNVALSQIAINHSIVESAPYTVGDTITIQYSMFNVASQDNLRSVWLRTQYSNKHLELIPSLTKFTGNDWQTFQFQWVGYRFVPNPNISVTSLDEQYYSSSWNYILDNEWNVNQLNFQSPSNIGNTVWATQKFVVKDQLSYTDIHKLDIGDIRNSAGVAIRPLTTNTSKLSLSDVVGASSSTTIKIHAPDSYPINKHKVVIYDVNNGVPNFQSIVSTLDVRTSADVFTTSLQTGKSYYVEVLPVVNESFLDDVITVTDAYKGFLQISDRGLTLDKNYFTFPLEYLVGDVTGDNLFDKTDAYILFAYISGLDIPSNYTITSTSSTDTKFLSGKLAGFSNGVFDNIINITEQNHVFDFAYAWGGDLDFSHSTPISKLTGSSSARELTSNILTNNVTVSSTLANNKVIVNFKLDGSKLAGTQFKVKFDNSVLELEDISFDAGNTITNYNTVNNHIVKFGSIDTFGNSKLKTNTNYKLTFKANKQLNNSTGLVFIDFAEGVSERGEKIKLIIK